MIIAKWFYKYNNKHKIKKIFNNNKMRYSKIIKIMMMMKIKPILIEKITKLI
jgi:hypothetical protein